MHSDKSFYDTRKKKKIVIELRTVECIDVGVSHIYMMDLE